MTAIDDLTRLIHIQNAALETLEFIDIVWETIKEKLPSLIQEINLIIEDIKTKNNS